MEDFQIIELYIARNEQAVRETDRKYGPLCIGIACNILHSPEDSEECVSDAYLHTWNSIPPEIPKYFRAFLCRITRNLSLKRLDYQLARKRTPELLLSFEELEAVLPDDRIQKHIEDREISEAVSRFLKAESADSRNVFIRKYWFCDSVRTISEKYGFSEGKIKSMLYRTRNRLKNYLVKEGISL